jgi:hypothetical protein
MIGNKVVMGCVIIFGAQALYFVGNDQIAPGAQALSYVSEGNHK